jgi:SAM-dependent methyltransferase
VDGIDVRFAGLRAAALVARAEGLRVRLVRADLERFRLPTERYDTIINIRYLQRDLAPQIRAALKPGGRLLFETYLLEQAAIGRPKNPDYLLRRGELLSLFRADLVILKYREGKFTERGGRQAYLASLIAERPA